MARSLKKGPYIDERLLAKVKRLKPGDKTIIKTWSRACTITPEMVSFTFGVHNCSHSEICKTWWKDATENRTKNLKSREIIICK